MKEQRELDLQMPADMTDVFHFADDQTNFNDLANTDNGFDYWYASDVTRMLGYGAYEPRSKPLQRAIAACSSLQIDIMENFKQERREVDGHEVNDYRLSRFACYLLAMNADPKKPQVARAQAFFAVVAESFRRYVEDSADVQRVLDREEIAEAEKSLGSTAHRAGVENFAYFQNAGYRGMYNMNLRQLKAIRDIPGNRSVLDFMGPAESAANRFRITQTEEKIKNNNITGQTRLEHAAEAVGLKVRRTMHELSGTKPESLPKHQDIRKVKSAIKSSSREFRKLDKPRT